MDSSTTRVRIELVIFSDLLKVPLTLFLREYHNNIVHFILSYSNTTLSCNRPVCTCGIHLAWSRSRLRMMNDNGRNTKLMEALTKVHYAMLNIMMSL